VIRLPDIIKNMIIRGVCVRINKKENYDVEICPIELKNKAERLIAYSYEISELRKLFSDIKNEASALKAGTLSKREQEEINAAARDFDSRIQANIYYTLNNFERYMESDWKKIIYERDEYDEIN
jgi:hypothetical protein